jgi:hypothetical protein
MWKTPRTAPIRWFSSHISTDITMVLGVAQRRTEPPFVLLLLLLVVLLLVLVLLLLLVVVVVVVVVAGIGAAVCAREWSVRLLRGRWRTMRATRSQGRRSAAP